MCPTPVTSVAVHQGGARISGGLVAIGGHATRDGASVAGDHPAVDAGPVGVNTDRVGTVPAHPEDVLAGALGLVLHGDHGRVVCPDRPASMLRVTGGTTAAGDNQSTQRPRTAPVRLARATNRPCAPHHLPRLLCVAISSGRHGRRSCRCPAAVIAVAVRQRRPRVVSRALLLAPRGQPDRRHIMVVPLGDNRRKFCGGSAGSTADSQFGCRR